MEITMRRPIGTVGHPGACGCNAHADARPPLPALGRAEPFDWRMFLSANRHPPPIKSGAGFRRNMRSHKSETRISAIADFAHKGKQEKKVLPLSPPTSRRQDNPRPYERRL